MNQKEHIIDRIFQALGDATRREMLERLSSGPMSVSLLAEPFNISLAAVVQHVQVLEEADLVKTEKAGRIRSCRIESAGLRAAEAWLCARLPEWERKLDRLEDILGESPENQSDED